MVTAVVSNVINVEYLLKDTLNAISASRFAYGCQFVESLIHKSYPLEVKQLCLKMYLKGYTQCDKCKQLRDAKREKKAHCQT
jgi:hypothetical protein